MIRRNSSMVLDICGEALNRAWALIMANTINRPVHGCCGCHTMCLSRSLFVWQTSCNPLTPSFGHGCTISMVTSIALFHIISSFTHFPIVWLPGERIVDPPYNREPFNLLTTQDRPVILCSIFVANINETGNLSNFKLTTLALMKWSWKNSKSAENNGG